MTRRLRQAVAAVALTGLTLGLGFAGPAPAHASGCPDPDNPCDPVPPKVGAPKVTFGCGTVTVTAGDVSRTLHVLPCPGPVLW